jgi:hypothetical protein
MVRAKALDISTFIEGIPGPFFAGQPSEATAFFTFKTEPILRFSGWAATVINERVWHPLQS